MVVGGGGGDGAWVFGWELGGGYVFCDSIRYSSLVFRSIIIIFMIIHSVI